MPKKISEKVRKQIIASFVIGESIDNLSKIFNLSKITISRHLKKSISESKYRELNLRNKRNQSISNSLTQEIKKEDELKAENQFSNDAFVEIEPLNYEIDNTPQKDLSSVPISEVELPNIVYMVVDKKIELETKYLNEYPDWQFLSKEELNRKTIEIFFDLKVAKRFCNKEQKVIKVPNSNVFRITSSLLLDKGISRIVSTNKLIAL